jgi:hypothetical protein
MLDYLVEVLWGSLRDKGLHWILVLGIAAVLFAGAFLTWRVGNRNGTLVLFTGAALLASWAVLILLRTRIRKPRVIGSSGRRKA